MSECSVVKFVIPEYVNLNVVVVAPSICMTIVRTSTGITTAALADDMEMSVCFPSQHSFFIVTISLLLPPPPPCLISLSTRLCKCSTRCVPNIERIDANRKPYKPQWHWTQTSITVPNNGIEIVARNATISTMRTNVSTNAHFPSRSSQKRELSILASSVDGLFADSSPRLHKPQLNGATQAYKVNTNLTYGQQMLRITIRIANAYDSLFHIFFTDVNTLIVPRVIAPFTSPVSSTLVSNLADAPSAMSDAISRESVPTRKMGMPYRRISGCA
mmetsp:Transcript_13906/g.29965  ORF Transcript_13906/g.29965 Transcript_13906/m.29965 type:complete len:273 (-) Transcript_13906:178-996(-)